MRQEQERMRANYERRKSQTADARKNEELEAELERTKAYYNKRIKDIEAKGIPGGKPGKPPKAGEQPSAVK